MKKALKYLRSLFTDEPYKGAGILLYRLRPDGGCNILLFKRAIHPGKGRYSITGGRLDAHEQDSFLAGAIRETREECGLTVRKEEVRMTLKTWLPGFRWMTFLVEFKGDVRDLRLRTSEVSEVIEVDASEASRYPLTQSMRYTLLRMGHSRWTRLRQSTHLTTGKCTSPQSSPGCFIMMSMKAGKNNCMTLWPVFTEDRLTVLRYVAPPWTIWLRRVYSLSSTISRNSGTRLFPRCSSASALD